MSELSNPEPEDLFDDPVMPDTGSLRLELVSPDGTSSGAGPSNEATPSSSTSIAEVESKLMKVLKLDSFLSKAKPKEPGLYYDLLFHFFAPNAA